ncbi:MAG: hypothetical protein ACRBBP_03940 [Bdellovibrionales bacterium]
MLSVSACKHVSQDEPLNDYPKDFTPYIENFENLFNIQTDSNIQFSSLSAGAPGRCLFEAKQIHINEDLWKDFSEATREALIIHELGHCELGLLHSEVQESHIMNSFIGHNVSAYTNNLDAEIEYMLSEEHPRINSN